MNAIVYRIYDENDDLLYIGCSGVGFGRLTQHARSKDWWRDVASVRIDHFDDLEAAFRHEAKLIGEMEPRYNARLRKTFKGFRGNGFVAKA